MSLPASWLPRLVLLCAIVWTLHAGKATAQAQTAATKGPPAAADPKINAQFSDPDVKSFVQRFETESREVYAKREAIAAAIGLKPGMAVADVGAGTGPFTRVFAEKVGREGAVYAVDISAPFLRHIAAQAKAQDRPQIKTVRAAQDRTNLAPGSIDLAFICDVYHHVERPGPWLATLHHALRPGGRLVLIEFDRGRAAEKSFVKSHVRADREVLVKEIVAAGFETIETPGAPALKENFIQSFRKLETPPR